MNLTVMETLERAAPDAKINDIKALLGRMMFTGKAQHKKVGVGARCACARTDRQTHVGSWTNRHAYMKWTRQIDRQTHGVRPAVRKTTSTCGCRDMDRSRWRLEPCQRAMLAVSWRVSFFTAMLLRNHAFAWLLSPQLGMDSELEALKTSGFLSAWCMAGVAPGWHWQSSRGLNMSVWCAAGVSPGRRAERRREGAACPGQVHAE
jgi:hypothetical protein